MAELARDYHESIQKEGINPDNTLRDQCTQEALASIKKTTSEDQKNLLKKLLTEEEVEEALQKSLA